MKFPDFIIAGCMKCGSTSLFINLSKHPEITMSGIFGPLSYKNRRGTGTEINYWDKWKKEGRDLDWYKGRFAGEFSGEKSPGYWTSMPAIRQSFRHNPNTKYILSVRNPVDRAHSHFMMNRIRWTNKPPFNMDTVKPIHKNLGFYHRKLHRGLLKVVPRKNIHVVVSDWMKTNPAEELMKIHKFLGIEEIDLPTTSIQWRKNSDLYGLSQDKDSYVIWDAHSKKSIKPKIRKAFLKMYEKANEDFFDYLGFRIPEWSE